MKRPIIKVIALVLLGYLFTSCSHSEPFVLDRIPITWQPEKPFVVELTQLAGDHPVGIQCTPDSWSELARDRDRISVRLTSGDRQATSVFAIEPGRLGTFCDQVPDTHYIFTVSARGRVLVQLALPGISARSKVELVVCKTPIQTEL